MEDLGQLIFVVLFILFGLISSSKKKGQQKPSAKGATRQPPSRAPVQDSPYSDGDLPVPRTQPAAMKEEIPPKRALADELLVLLQGGQPEPVSEPVVADLEIDDEAQSIETLEPAGEESHKRFHERYVDTEPQARPYDIEEAPASRPYAVTRTPAERPYLVEEEATQLPYAIHDSLQGKRRLTRRELRHAFVMKEILGPPKALE